MSLRKLLFLGAGTFAVEALEIAEAMGNFVPVGFVNSLARPAPGTRLEGLPVFWVDEIPLDPAEGELVCAIFTTERRPFIELMRSRGYRFATLIHPFSNVSRRARIGAGCIVNAGVVVGSNAELGDHTIVNRGAMIGHDDRTGTCCSIGPGANLAGYVSIGEGVFVAQGAVIRERLRIGDNAVVGAGAVVLEDVKVNDMVAGVPARTIRTGVNGH